jgi:hypothetical protein
MHSRCICAADDTTVPFWHDALRLCYMGPHYFADAFIAAITVPAALFHASFQAFTLSPRGSKALPAFIENLPGGAADCCYRHG